MDSLKRLFNVFRRKPSLGAPEEYHVYRKKKNSSIRYCGPSRWLDIEQASTSQHASTARNPANTLKIKSDFLVHSMANVKYVYYPCQCSMNKKSLNLSIFKAQYMLQCKAKVACGHRRISLHPRSDDDDRKYVSVTSAISLALSGD